MINNVLLAVDSYENSENALNFMQKMIGNINNIIVLTVIDSSFALSETQLQQDSDEYNEYPAAQHEETLAIKQLKKVAIALQNIGFKTEAILSAGIPVEVIPEKIKKYNCELLIISHRHLSSLGRLLNTSLTRSLLDDIKEPVIVVPR